MGPTPLLLLLLLSSFSLAQTQDCDEHATCYYTITCFEGAHKTGSKPQQSKSTVLSIFGTTTLASAMKTKGECKGSAYITTLSILFTSKSSMNISFETDLEKVGFAFGVEANASFMEYNTNGTLIARVNGIGLDVQHSHSSDSLGHSTHSFQMKNREGRSLYSLLGQGVSFVLDQKRNSFSASQFWNNLRTKLPCDTGSIYDTCHGFDDCEKILISAHSVKCPPGSQLQLKSGESWVVATAAFCRDESWKFKTSKDKEMSPTEAKIPVVCRKTDPNGIATTQPPSGKETDEEKNTTVPSTDSSDLEEPVEEPSEISQVVERRTAAATTTTGAPTAERKQEKGVKLPGNKWAWIGGSGTLIFFVSVLSIIGCLMCRRKRKEDKQQSKISKASKKAKGGKAGTSDSKHLSSSGSKAADPSRPLNAPNSNNPMPTSDDNGLTVKMAPKSDEVAKTEMNLDVIKTEYS